MNHTCVNTNVAFLVQATKKRLLLQQQERNNKFIEKPYLSHHIA